MPKKSKSKRGVGGGDDKNAEEAKEKLGEVDRESFLIQIKALEEKLQRRTDRMHQLEAANTEFHQKYEQLKEDKADVVDYLKRTLQQRLDQIVELQARLEGLKEVHQADKTSYESQLEQLRVEAAKTKEQLVSENMVLAKKLDALEEFRIQREQLMSKFESQERGQAQTVKDYERKLELQEKKHILEEDRLKREMMSKLESVASEFRAASHGQMAATTQRTIRENVNISAQNAQLSEQLAEVTSENRKLFRANGDLRRRIENLEDEQRRLIRGNVYKVKVVEELASRCASQEEQLRKMGTFHAERRQYEHLVSRLRAESDDLRTELTAVKGDGRAREGEVAAMARKLAGADRNRGAVEECLADASGAIKAALAFQRVEDVDSLDESESKGKREEVLNQLLTMLNAAVEKRKKEREEEGARYEDDDDGEAGYMEGSLGLVPIM